jgi:hypothetical protein
MENDPQSRVDRFGRGMGPWNRTLEVPRNRCHLARGRFERASHARSRLEKGQYLSLLAKFIGEVQCSPDVRAVNKA